MSDQLPEPGIAGAACRREAEPVTGEAGLNKEAVNRKSLLLAGFVADMSRGDHQALACLYDETSSLINGFLLRILESPQDAEEALLDVYMKAWKNAGAYSPERGRVQSWLVVMARSIAIDRIRQKRAQPNTAGFELGNAAEFISGAASPEEQTEDARRSRKVRTSLEVLPPEQRQVVELAFYGGYTHSELARRLGQPLGTVKSRIRMALLRLRDLLGEGGVA